LHSLLLAGLPAQALSAYVLLALNQHVENLALIDGTPEVHRQLDDRGDTNHPNLSGRQPATGIIRWSSAVPGGCWACTTEVSPTRFR
jgi:hypothetical protein